MRLDELFDHSVEYPFPAAMGKPAVPTEAGAAAGQEAETAKSAGPVDPLPGAGGVYLLTDAEDRIIQLASAGNLRRALQIRLAGRPQGEAQPAGGPSRRRADLGQIVRKIRWRTAHSAFEISYEYWRLARILLPETYLKQLAFGPAWFVHVDPASAIPRFLVGKVLRSVTGGRNPTEGPSDSPGTLPGKQETALVLRSPPGVDLGPFFTNGDATRFVQVLEDGFDLCRYYHILEQVPHGKACAYFDMGRCPAPCDGSIPMSRYQEMIADALAFAAGDREPTYGRCEAAMREAAARQAYEEASRLKQRLERLREIEHKAFAQVGPIERFNWLIVQRGGGRTRVKPFFVRSGAIAPGEVITLKQLDVAMEKWLGELGTGRLRQSVETGTGSGELIAVSPDRQMLSEQIWLVSHFLGKKEPPGLFLNGDRLPAPADLAQTIRACFRKPEPPPEADSTAPADPDSPQTPE